MNISGWWVDLHASRAGIETRIRMACEVAEMRYGEDLTVNLGQRASDHEPTRYRATPPRAADKGVRDNLLHHAVAARRQPDSAHAYSADAPC